MKSVQNYGFYVIIVLVTVFVSSSFSVCYSYSDEFELVENGGEENSDKNEGLEEEKDSEEIYFDARRSLKNSLFAFEMPIYMPSNFLLLYPELCKPPPQYV